MFRKLISVFLIFSVLSFSAQAGPQAGLKEAFDDLNYALTVEWDQVDPAFYQAQTQKFYLELKSLRNDGLSDNDLLAFVKSKITDQEQLAEIENVLNLINTQKMSHAEATELILSLNLSQKGASWNGVIYVLGGVGVLVMAYFTLIILDSLDITA